MRFLFEDHIFQMDGAERYDELYLPLTNESGVMNCITPDGHGDSKISQNEFLMPPVSVEELRESMFSRNFWCQIQGYGAWSAYGTSAKQQGERFTEQEEQTSLEVGFLWQKTTRVHRGSGLKAEVLSFCPPCNERAEIMQVTLENTGAEAITVKPTAAIPIYARSADNLRDHRHVTSLLNRMQITEDGVEVIPALSFDERGHQINERVYAVYARETDGTTPEAFYPVMKDFTGDGGSLYWPKAVVTGEGKAVPAGTKTEGYEALGGICFREIRLAAGEKKSYLIVISYDREGRQYLEPEQVQKAFGELESYWSQKNPIRCKTGDQNFDFWMEWTGIQPYLRRIYGCSFLPHHDYGRGGRGWRDLWQDCLALILTNPADIRENLINFYSGVRLDGSNATIIGANPGEFKADRNTIVRVWMDHGYWPVVTTRFYLEQTGDYELLLEEAPYFSDGLTCRGEKRIPDGIGADGHQICENGETYIGTVLEHMLIQNVTQFFDVGEHNHMKLRGADWNDALDMAKDKGESVAFTAAYSGNYETLADLMNKLDAQGHAEIRVSKELAELLLSPAEHYESPEKKQEDLQNYYESCMKLSGEKVVLNASECADTLRQMADWIHRDIRAKEVVQGKDQEIWFNGYYDNDGEAVENAEQERMMLTSQVFSIMSETATDEQIEWIARSVERYLFDETIGGYRLNTDFKEVKLNMGRAFGFAYGHKENGAVFSHMTVMYAYALYSRGFAREGYRVIQSLQNQSMNFERSGIYPGIPEYFNNEGRGLYHYLTGAASWLVLTVTTQMFGVRGKEGNLVFAPQLMKEQFDQEGNASIRVRFMDRDLLVIYQNADHKDIGDYEVEEIYVDDERIQAKTNGLSGRFLQDLEKDKQHVIKVVL